MPAIACLVFRIAPLQIKSRFLITFFVQIMHQGRVGIARHLARQFIQPIEKGQETGLRVRHGHRFHGAFQFDQRLQ